MRSCRLLLSAVFLGLALSEPWEGSVLLEEGLQLFWNPGRDSLEAEIVARTRGYVGIALNRKDTLAGADILMAWVDDLTGNGHIVDSHGVEDNAIPLEDSVQNYKLLSFSQNRTHTVIKFSRLLDTCDTNQDVPITNSTMRVMWTISETDPGKTSSWDGIVWHGKKGIHLVTPPRAGHPKKNHHYWDVMSQDLLLSEESHTFYWCKIYKVPPLEKKHHIIGYEPILERGHERLVQHMILYECLGTGKFEQYGSHQGAGCHAPNKPKDWDACITPVVAWASGSQGEFYPDNVGLSMAEGEGKATYFMLEMHYDNPALQKIRDNSGLRLFYTDHLRKYDGAMFTTGIEVSPIHIIPPKQQHFTSSGYCDNQCTNLMFPELGIKVVSVVFHSHEAGRQMHLRHVREGKELQIIAQDDQFDPSYQQSRRIPQELTIMPGDDLITECVYNTSNRTRLTLGGYSSKQEVCTSYIFYYPRIALAGCTSMTPVDFFFKTLGVKEFYDHDMEEIEKILLKQSDKQIPKVNKLKSSSIKSLPRQSLFFSYSEKVGFNLEANMPSPSIMKAITELNIDMDGDDDSIFSRLVIYKPDEFQNKSFMNHMKDLPWKEMIFTQRLEEIMYKGKHRTFCKLQDSSPAMPSGIYNFPNLTDISLMKKNSTKCQRDSNGAGINYHMENLANKHYIAHIYILLTTIIIIMI